MLKSLRKSLSRFRPLRYIWHSLGNWRRGRARKLDYILLLLPSAMPALPEQRSWMRRRVQGDPPLSLADLDLMFRQIGADPRPQGVILQFRGLALPLADLQSLRQSIIRLRKQGKRVIAYASSYDNRSYYAASACDEIILQPGGLLDTLGLVSQPVFLRSALDAIGVQMDSVAITPFKGALDMFTRDEISPEGREQLNWLLDSQYEILLEGIAEGRCMEMEAVRAMIDTAPHLDKPALEAGYVDALLREEDLAAHLGDAKLRTWDDARKVLLREWRPAASQYVAVLPVSGMMVEGESANPPVDLPIPFLGGERMGDLTVVKRVRALMQDKSAAAVVLWIDSGGGSMMAVDAMASALRELAKDRPLVAYMNNVAGSGGYYIATPAQWIVAQPGSITGSIGVIMGKAVTGGLYDKLKVQRSSFTRGANATIFSDNTPFDEQQRTQMRAMIEHAYQQFIELVAESRHLTLEAVDAVGGGRVWTGRQALAHGLIDEVGDLKAAVAKARALADLPDSSPAVVVQSKAKAMVPQLAEEASPAAALRYMQENLRALSGSVQALMPVEWR